MEMVYRSTDGQIFDDLNACVIHEKRKELAVMDYVEFLVNGEKICYDCVDLFAGSGDELVTIGRADTIIIPNIGEVENALALETVGNLFNFNFDKVGVWVYSYDLHTWEQMEDKITRLLKEVAEAERISFEAWKKYAEC